MNNKELYISMFFENFHIEATFVQYLAVYDDAQLVTINEIMSGGLNTHEQLIIKNI